jgi:hypothetical protein
MKNPQSVTGMFLAKEKANATKVRGTPARARA